MAKPRPLTTYPEPETRRAIERIAGEDHDRPVSKMVLVAMKAFVVLYERDKYEAMKLADSFDQRGAS